MHSSHFQVAINLLTLQNATSRVSIGYHSIMLFKLQVKGYLARGFITV